MTTSSMESGKAFGAVIKEGLYEDMERRDQLFEVVRFKSTKSDKETVSLEKLCRKFR